MQKHECPHCGNTDPETIEHNGARPHSPDLTLLCLAPCAPEDSSFDHLPMSSPDRRRCGMQWEPNRD